MSWVVGPASDSPDVVLVGVLAPNSEPSAAPVWHAIDLATGSDVAPPSGLDGVGLRASNGRHAVFGPSGDQVVDVDNGQLVVLDLVTLQSSPIPIPPEFVGPNSFRFDFDITDDGSVQFRNTSTFRVTAAVFSDGEWRTDASSILAASPISVEFSFDGDVAELDGRNGLGELLWSRPELTDASHEGFRIATSDGVTILSACVTRSAETGCTDEMLSGVVSETGEILWQLPGSRSVPAAGDGFALVTGGPFAPSDAVPAPPGYMMIDTTTGQAIGDGRWDDPDAFRTGCCGEGEFVWVERDGGVLIATNHDHIRVWYPATIDAAIQSVSIDD